jgi:hypothetical protein
MGYKISPHKRGAERLPTKNRMRPLGAPLVFQLRRRAQAAALQHRFAMMGNTDREASEGHEGGDAAIASEPDLC